MKRAVASLGPAEVKALIEEQGKIEVRARAREARMRVCARARQAPAARHAAVLLKHMASPPCPRPQVTCELCNQAYQFTQEEVLEFV